MRGALVPLPDLRILDGGRDDDAEPHDPLWRAFARILREGKNAIEGEEGGQG